MEVERERDVPFGMLRSDDASGSGEMEVVRLQDCSGLGSRGGVEGLLMVTNRERVKPMKCFRQLGQYMDE